MSGVLSTGLDVWRARTGSHCIRCVCVAAASCLLGCEASAPPARPDASEESSTRQSDSEPAAPEEFAPLTSPPREVPGTGDTTGLNPATNAIPAEKSEASQPASNASPPHLRLPDDRPDINELRLKQAGIAVYRSERLILLTDVAPSEVAHLPALADQLFAALEAHFGTLPKASDGSSFQVTGHLIGDEARFRQAALMPQAALTFQHGRHLNYQFWMYHAPTDYYRRHLLLHEFTHCFMTCESGMLDIPPLWYIEGMAEYFATHELSDNQNRSSQQARFGVLPEQFAGFEGWGRISEIRRAFNQQASVQTTPPALLSIASLSDVTPDTVSSFDQDLQYAYSWAMCWLLNQHPQHRDAFLSLATRHRRQPFIRQVTELKQTSARLPADWLLFIEDLREGYDQQRSFPLHAEHSVVWKSETEPQSISVAADRGWQDTGIRLNTGQQVSIAADGSFQVGAAPRPWISEPQGISIDYVRGLPLGQLVAILVGADGEQISNRLSIGRGAHLTAPFDCSVWLQINDFSNSRHDNLGRVQVIISPAVNESPG